jgi:hypothetical protein
VRRWSLYQRVGGVGLPKRLGRFAVAANGPNMLIRTTGSRHNGRASNKA